MLKNEQFDLPLAFQNNWKPKPVHPVDHVSSFKKYAEQQVKKTWNPTKFVFRFDQNRSCPLIRSVFRRSNRGAGGRLGVKLDEILRQ